MSMRILFSVVGAGLLAAAAAGQDDPPPAEPTQSLSLVARSTNDGQTPLVLIAPELPRRVQRAGLEGLCSVSFPTLPDGTPDEASIVVECEHEEHVTPVERAVAQWRYNLRFVDPEVASAPRTASLRFCADGSFTRAFGEDEAEPCTPEQ